MSLDHKPLSLRSNTQIASRHVSLASGTLLALGSTLLMPISHAADTSATTVTSETLLEGVTVTAKRKPVTAAAANPNADPEAPYKIDKSGNSKFTEPLLNVSKTITVVGKEQLKDSGTTALKELMRSQPGITLGTGEGGNAVGDRFIIRGFDSRNDLFTDGLRDPGVTTREVFNTEQIEIAKGPSSTFAGRGTTGGAVNSVSKKPQNTHFAKGSVTVGNDKRVTLDANRVLSDKLKVRANVMVQDSEVAGRNEVFDKRKGLALAADYQATDKVSVLADYYHLKGESIPDFGHPWDPTTNKPVNVKRDNFYGIVGRDFQDTSADIFTTTLQVDFSNNTRLTSKMRAGETTNDYVAGAPEGANIAAGTVQSRAKSGGFTNKIMGNNTQITHERHSGNTEHTIIAGFDISNEEVSNQPYVSTTVVVDIQNPNNKPTSVPSVTRRDFASTLKAQSRSLYAMDTIKFNEQWQLFGGLRYDQFKIHNNPINYATGVPTGSARYDRGFTNGHVGLVFKPKANASVYTSYSTSSNLPGEMYDGVGDVAYGGLTEAIQDFKPEQNKSIELGTKWNVANDNLALSAAVFQTDKKNKIESLRAGAVTTYHQTGAIRVKGIEFGVSGNPTPKLNLSGGLTYMDTEVTHSADPTIIGKEVANVAAKSASLQTKYQVTPKLALGGTVVHTGKIKGGAFAATTDRELPSSNRLDLMAQYKLSKKLTAQLNVNNATDETIYEALYRSGSPFTYVAPGRAVNVTFNYDF